MQKYQAPTEPKNEGMQSGLICLGFNRALKTSRMYIYIGKALYAFVCSSK